MDFVRAEPAITSQQRAYQMIREGLLPAVHIGRRIYIDPMQWENFKATGGKALAGGWRRDPERSAV